MYKLGPMCKSPKKRIQFSSESHDMFIYDGASVRKIDKITP